MAYTIDYQLVAKKQGTKSIPPTSSLILLCPPWRILFPPSLSPGSTEVQAIELFVGFVIIPHYGKYLLLQLSVRDISTAYGGEKMHFKPVGQHKKGHVGRQHF